MGNRKRALSITLLLVFFLSFMASCGDDSQNGKKDAAIRPDSVRLNIVSGSENKELEPLIHEFARREGARVHMVYMGSVDMMLALQEQGSQIPYDAIWPANSIWLMLGDRQKVVRRAESILRSPVILGVKKSIARDLGWIDSEIMTSDFLKAVQQGKLRFSMTSATQSNSGASAFLGFLHALAGSPDVLRMQHLEDPTVREKIRSLLSKVERSSGSSGWLKSSLVEHPDRFQAMVNYESMIIEANRELVAENREPLYAIYPRDGIMISDSPLGYIDKGNPKKEQLFEKLQTFLLSDAAQEKILKLGRRTGLIGLNPELAGKEIFNPRWGIDPARIISPVPTPEEDVIRQALVLYQTALRKPSCTAYVLDVSGSMEGKGIQDLKEAMSTLLDPQRAKRYLLQPSPEDIHLIIPFNSAPMEGIQAMGNAPETLNNLLNFVYGLRPGGGTNIYAAAAHALKILSSLPNIDNLSPAIILMTDGQSKGSIETLKHAMDTLPMGRDIPIHSITFGSARERQLNEISRISIGRVFPGHDLVKAFREAKGYN